MKTNNSLIPDDLLMNKIYFIRGQKVMLDFDLAKLYDVETKVLKQSVRRNLNRFPEDFMFQLDSIEFEILRSQIVTSKLKSTRYMPMAFTEHGILMLSSVLRSDVAVDINIQIVRIFVKMRKILSSQKELFQRILDLEANQESQGSEIKILFEYLTKLMQEKEEFERTSSRRPIGYARKMED